MNDIIARYTSLNEIAWVGRRMWRVSLRWLSSRDATVLVHAHSCTPGKSGSQPFSTPAVSLCLCRFSHARCHPPPPLVPVSFYLFLPALSTHPLFIRAPPVHVHARAHTPSLTLSATTSVLHSKALTSETSASTSKDGFIGYSFPPRARDAAGQTENFNRDRREV